MSPKMTLLELLYLVAMEARRDAKTVLLGPPWPTIAPSEVSVSLRSHILREILTESRIVVDIDHTICSCT